MAQGIGKALASAIKEPAQAGPAVKRGRHMFRNQHRRCIFSALTLKPCIGIAELASECGVSHSTVEWHLEELVRSGYVVRYASGRRRLFYPEGLITRELAGTFELINHRKVGDIFRTVLANPGITQAGIAAALGKGRKAVPGTLARLEAGGLVSRMADGAHARYYPSELLPRMAEGFYTRSREFFEFVIRKLEAEGGGPPQVVKRGVSSILVEAGYAPERFTLEIGVNPYMTCGAC